MHGSQSSVHQGDRMAASCCDVDAGSPVSSSGLGLGSCRELRSTLPVVRSPNKSMERPLGQVFLLYHGETKRAILPNEVTSIDTVRALFVRSFPKCLSMRWFDSPFRKIYILDSATNVFYELEDLSEIRDRVVLKIFEQTDCLVLASPRTLQQTRPSYEGLARTMPFDFSTSVSSLGQASSSVCTSPHEVMEKTHSLPPSASSLQSVALPPQLSSNPWPYNQAQCTSPSRGLPLNQRHSVACLPEPVPCLTSRVLHSRDGYQDCDRDVPLSAYSSGTVTPSGGDTETRNRMQKMESQLASLTAWVQTAMYKQGKASEDGTSCRNTQRSATLSAPNSVKSSVSDISTSTPQPMVSVSMLNVMCTLRRQTLEVRSELCQLRSMQLAYADCLRVVVQDVFEKIKVAMDNVPELQSIPSSHTRHLTTQAHLLNYRLTAEQITEGLRDLEKLVEEIRKDVVGRKCRVNMAEVESLALALSHISRSLADLKSGFPKLHEKMKSVMETEMDIVAQEEKFLKDEPLRVEESLKRSKKLMGTLLTLKKLASVQEKRPVSVPFVSTRQDLTSEDRHALLLNIKTLTPNHEARMQSLEDAAVAQERKKKLTGNMESLRFEKILELAQRQLRETDNMARNAARQEQILSLIFLQRNALSPSDGTGGGPSCSSSGSGLKSNSPGDADQPSISSDSATKGTNPIEGRESAGNEISEVDDDTSGGDTKRLDARDVESFVNSSSAVMSNAAYDADEVHSKVSAPHSPTATFANEPHFLQTLVPSAEAATSGTTKSNASTTSSSSPLEIPAVASPAESTLNSSGPPSPALLSPVVVSPTHTKKELDGSTRSKKVAPPPPPRKTVSPNWPTISPNWPAVSPNWPTTSADDATADIFYANVASCKQDSLEQTSKDSLEQTSTSKGTSRPQSVFGPLSKPDSLPFSKSRPISQYGAGDLRSKAIDTSTDIAVGGGFFNGNGQVLFRKEPGIPSQTSVVDKLSAVCCQRDSDSDSSTSADSQTGTIKRAPGTKEEPTSDGGGSKVPNKPSANGNTSRETSRVPPPVPLRKSSTLSCQRKPISSPVAQHQYSNLQEIRRERALLEREREAERKTPKMADASSAVNGELPVDQSTTRQATLNPGHKAERRKCEETEIY